MVDEERDVLARVRAAHGRAPGAGRGMGMRHAAAMSSQSVLRLACAVVAARWSLRGDCRSAERMGYPPEEFAARRQQLAKRAPARARSSCSAPPAPTPGVRFRQDNDFFYLTGNEALNARARHGRAERRGAPLHAEAERDRDPLRGRQLARRDRRGARSTASPRFSRSPALHEFLGPPARRAGHRDALDAAVGARRRRTTAGVDIAIGAARRLTNPFAQQPTEDAARVDRAARAVPVLRRRRT